MGNYKGINQNGLALHKKAKQKTYKEEKKITKPCETSSFLLEAYVFL